MQPSGGFQDVRKFLSFWRSLFLRTKKLAYRRFYGYRMRPFRVVIVGAVLIFSFFIVRGIFTRAEVTDFYPTTCLGDWQDPQNAQGKPESFETSPARLNESNSSVYFGGGGKIFCGNFLPQDYNAKGDLVSAGLTLVWRVGDEPKVESPTSPEITPSPSGTAPNATSSEASADPTPTPIPENISSTLSEPTPPEPSPEPQPQTPPPTPQPEPLPPAEPPPAAPPSLQQDVPPPTSSINHRNFSFLDYVLRSVFAQESNTVETPAVTAPAPEETIAPEPQVPSAAPPEEIAPPPAPEAQPENISDSEPAVQPQDEPSAPPAAEFEATPPLPPPPDDHFIAISYSLDGQEWFVLEKIDANNWPNFTLTLPIKSWDELAKLQISIEGIPTALASVPRTFLDGMLVEAHYDLPPILQKVEIIAPEIQTEPEVPVITLPEDQKPVPADPDSSTFGAQESPAFDFNLEGLPLPASSATTSAPLPTPAPQNDPNASSSTGLHAALRLAARNFFLNFFKFSPLASAQATQSNLPTMANPIVAEVYDPQGRRTGIQPTFLTVNNQLRITIPEPSISFKPGRYAMHLWVLRHGTIYYVENNFTWGVLVVNFNKSIYTAGDEAKMGFAVLDNGGHTICDADLEASVTAPSGKVHKFSTRNKTIAYSSSCGAQTITNNADYSADLIPKETGTYTVLVVADTHNGKRIIKDAFEVRNSTAFDVERSAPTRIYPPALYKVSIFVKANEDFKGNIVEVIPASFRLITERQTVSAVQSDTQTISWPVDLKSGEKTELTYFFDAPDVSPELYKLGPLAIGAWQEARKWQIASDAAGEVILLWDGGSTLPAGWTCISCAASDAFKDVMPRVSSTYGNASSGLNTHNHTLTFSNASATAATEAGNTATGGTAAPTNAHTHSTWTAPELADGDIRPPFNNLLLIKASSPTTLPSGTIGMFTGTSGSLPANWTYYSAMEDKFLMGSNATTTGGAATHTHATSTAPFSSTGVGGLADGGNGAQSAAFAHGHAVAESGSLTNHSNGPPYVGIVFGKLTADNDPIPNGLLAFFDNASLPTNWNVYSTSGSPYVGSFIQGTSTFGSTGGSSANHNHGGTVTFISGASTSTLNNKSGASSAWAQSAHTHSVAFTISSTSSLPVYRDVILGQYSTPTNSPPTVSAVVLNSGSAITLSPNVTTTITAVASTTDSENNIRFATATVYRSGVGPTCKSSGLDCYQLASSSCSFLSSTSTVSCSTGIYYFSDATDSSSSYSSQNWLADISVTDASSSAGTASTTAGVELNTLVGISVSTTTTNYGTLSPNTDTTSTNQVVAVKNAGNASSVLQLSGTALTSGSNSIATSSQHYATTTFTFSATSSALSDAAVTVSGFGLPRPGLVTSTWASVNSPGSIANHASVSYQNYLYVIGGSASTTDELATNVVRFAQVNADGSLTSWTNTTALPGITTGAAAAVNSAGYVYVLGGRDDLGNITSTVYYGLINIDGTISSWSTTTALPSAYGINVNVKGLINNDFIYIVGGATTTVLYTSSTVTGTLNSWQTTTVLPSALSNHAVAVNNNYLYVLGGATSAVSYAPINATGSIGAWSSTTAINTTSTLSSHAAIANGDFVYIVGGANTSTVIYAPTNPNGTLGTWILGTAHPETNIRNHAVVVANGKLYSLSGTRTTAPGAAVITRADYTVMSTKNIYWGLQVPSGVATGTYSGTNTYTASYSP